MKMRVSSFATCLLIIAAALMATPSAANHLTIGSISRNVKKEIRDFQPLADYLNPRLDVGHKKGAAIIVLPTAEDMVLWLQNGVVDVYIDSPFIAVQVASEAGAKPLLRRWKDGIGEYQSILFTLDASGVRLFDELKGKVVAFD